MRSVLCLVGLVLSSLPLLAVTIGKPAKSRVPAWDVRGPLTLPSQGTACLDATADGRFCAVGTIAMPGDAQLFLLDDTGHVVEAHPVGERGVTEVAVGDNGAFVAALVGVPAGTAGDIPVVKLFVDGKPAPLNNDFVPGFRALFHYGDHSNHLGHQLQAVGDRLAIGGASEVAWVTPRTGVMNRAPLGKVGAGELSTFACAADGHAVVGRAVGKDAGKALGVLGPTGALWSIAPGDEDGPALDFGVYGPAAGKPIDTRVWAPLSVAMGRDGARCAAAEYPGWSRHFPRGDDYGLHYPAARPAISVYDAAGAVLCHVDPAKLDPGWYDLAFTADGARLLIYPHSYPSQGLGGVGFLPADLPAHTLYVLTIADGTVAPVTFPDAVAGVAEANGRLAVSCWNGTLYLLDAALKPLHEIDLGAAALLRASTDGSRILAAGTDGVVHGLDADGHARWRTDLHAVAPPGVKPWTLNQTARKIGDVWAKSTQRTHSDMGNQYYIEAPDGILLIDPNSGLSIEQNFAQMRAAGLDPLRVKYILLTHEHGDHAPGAYLWRLLTGAQVVSSPEMATSLQHHIPHRHRLRLPPAAAHRHHRRQGADPRPGRVARHRDPPARAHLRLPRLHLYV